MSSPPTLALRWSHGTGLNPHEQLALFLKEPMLEPAMRRLSQNMLALAAGDRAIDGIVKDVGRYFAAAMAMNLHATGGLTLSRLKQYCADTGLISPGRARAILLYLRFLKYVEPVPGVKRGNEYVPTASMRNAWSAIMRAGLDAVQVMEPEIARISRRLANPATVFALCRIQADVARTAGGEPTDNAFWRVFLNRHAGTQILHALMLNAGASEHYPPHGPIAFSLSRLARDFHVSRPHVARMLRAAEKEGLLELEGSNALRFTAEGLRHLTVMLAARLRGDLLGAITMEAEQAHDANLRRTA